MVPGKWKQTLDPRFVRMKYLSDSEREICKARLIDQCFALANFTQLMANQRQWLGSVGSVRPSGIVQIGTDALDTTATNSNGQGLHPNVTTGVALPPGNFAVHSEPELVRDLVFVHNNC
ncbi:hypothetical protein BBO99_00006591 [Phytophthora kernoviae]|uniref:Uncharacterized protein n=2 Tax=Phytophthora kernoviae TaxID=325452 RepID=A0A3R7IQS3_9STRA|nr:hypothetical protein G195_007406 [Phytophthora kernoviae 00238/432]KAG2528693.1 hypothetical protein JM18_003187 [Phytophthora kernoviae]RLN46027.1 hypothetical protein BBI17_006614 [Phytophthora kernoviae]RLN77651.1 hypothetical protein BBO99_00006591 [Phytophthora kernoviae]